MNLVEQFNSLSIPTETIGKIFNADTIPDFPNCRVAIDGAGYPVLLLSALHTSPKPSLKNFRLRYLELLQNVECRITENDKTTFDSFSVITFISSDPFLQSYFLRIAEPFVRSLSNNPSQQEILETLNKFVEIFQLLGDTPTKSIQGLWSELFLIDNCINPTVLLSFWHKSPEEKFDFNSGSERIEVKSSSTFERKHSFASEQLNPPVETRAIIASILVKHDGKGKSIQDLINSITSKVADVELIEKLNAIVCKTLGNSLEQSLRIRFDYLFSKSSLKFYQHENVAKIKEEHIPREVNEVRFISDLSKIKDINMPSLLQKGVLFGGI